MSGLDGDDNDDSEMDEKEAEAKAFEEIKRIFGLPDGLKEIVETSDSNPEIHQFWAPFTLFSMESLTECARTQDKNPVQTPLRDAATHATTSQLLGLKNR